MHSKRLVNAITEEQAKEFLSKYDFPRKGRRAGRVAWRGIDLKEAEVSDAWLLVATQRALEAEPYIKIDTGDTFLPKASKFHKYIFDKETLYPHGGLNGNLAVEIVENKFMHISLLRVEKYLNNCSVEGHSRTSYAHCNNGSITGVYTEIAFDNYLQDYCNNFITPSGELYTVNWNWDEPMHDFRFRVHGKEFKSVDDLGAYIKKKYPINTKD